MSQQVLGRRRSGYSLCTVSPRRFLLDYPATPGLTILEAMSASIATLGNIGPGFGALGPFGNYLHFPTETKLVMVFLMWVGRLEIVPILAIFTGVFWRSS